MTVGALTRESGGSVKTGPFGTTLKAAEYSADGVPVISVGEVGYGRLGLHETTPRVSLIVTERLPEYVLQGGDIVFARKGAVDRVAWVAPEENGWFLGSDGIRLRLGGAADSRFLCYQLQSAKAREWLLQHAAGSTMASLNQRIIERIPVTIPPAAEQRAIAEVLGALDDKIAANTRLAAATDEYLATLFDRALRSSDVREAQLDDVALINVRSVNPGEGDLRYIDIAAVGEGHYAFPDLTPWATAPSRARRAVGHGDTLWSTVRPNRRSHALNLSNDPLLAASTGLAVLSPKSVGFAYLYEVARRPEFSAYLETVAEGSAYPAVRAERFATAPVPMIEDCARQKFEEIAAPLREHMHAHATENLTLAATRDALLPALMSGKLRVRDAERAVEQTV